GRALFERWGWLRRYSQSVLPQTERLVQRHGGKVVFFGRFIAVLRYTAAWVAGLGRMPWWRVLFLDALGGITWAVAVGLTAYYAGDAAAHAIERYGVFAGVGIAAAIVVGLLVVHIGKRRIEDRL